MLKDYFKILCISPKASQEEIKNAFRKQALRWHPDKNHNSNTTYKMQEINEAYLILSDIEARARYDVEYDLFKKKIDESVKVEGVYSESQTHDYVIQDEVLLKWISNAGKQAADLAKKTFQDSVGMSVAGIKAAFSEMKYWILVYVALQVIWILVYLFRSTNM